jgi:two-component system response regulator MprA
VILLLRLHSDAILRGVRILVADDEPSVRDALERVLRHERFDVALAADGPDALTALATARPDAMILDVMMPGLDGLEVCRRTRAAGDRTPILMLTARDEVGDRVAGLDAGADDYLAKPFALEELLARLTALLRRSEWSSKESEVLRFDDVRLDRRTLEVHRGERPIELTRTEHLLLEMFLEHPRHVLSRTAIFERVWDYDFGPESNSLQVYVGYLRRKLEAGGEPRLIHTVRSVGYVLRSA